MRDPSPELAERLATGAGDLAAGVASLLRAFARAGGRGPTSSAGRPPAGERDRRRGRRERPAAETGSAAGHAARPARRPTRGATPPGRAAMPVGAEAGRLAVAKTAADGSRSRTSPSTTAGPVTRPADRAAVPASRVPDDAGVDAPRRRRLSAGRRHATACRRRAPESDSERGAAAVTLTIGVDVGGTKVARRCRRRRPARSSPRPAGTPRPTTSAKTRDVIVEVVSELAAGTTVDGGRHRRGRLDRRDPLHACSSPPTSPGGTNRCATTSATAVGLPVVVENDGNAAAWAEFRYGAARDADDSMVMFTIGTGIGGGIVLGGELVPRRARHRRRAGPHAGRAGRAPLRLRAARLPRAVRQRQRAGPLRAGRRPAGPATAPPRCWTWPAARSRRSPARW